MNINKFYREHKDEIDMRLDAFRQKGESSEREVFAEMCFCILTPQSRALLADKAIKRLKKNFLLYTGSAPEIRKYLKGVRFPNNKASYIIETRARFTGGGHVRLKDFLKNKDVFTLRKKLVGRVKGFGLKEASHFLRNIGRGMEIAILDRHILNELKNHGVIEQLPKNMSKKKYLEVESKMLKFANRKKIPPDALDMIFWFKETGYFFK